MAKRKKKEELPPEETWEERHAKELEAPLPTRETIEALTVADGTASPEVLRRHRRRVAATETAEAPVVVSPPEPTRRRRRFAAAQTPVADLPVVEPIVEPVARRRRAVERVRRPRHVESRETIAVVLTDPLSRGTIHRPVPRRPDPVLTVSEPEAYQEPTNEELTESVLDEYGRIRLAHG